MADKPSMVGRIARYVEAGNYYLVATTDKRYRAEASKLRIFGHLPVDTIVLFTPSAPQKQTRHQRIKRIDKVLFLPVDNKEQHDTPNTSLSSSSSGDQQSDADV